MRSTRTTAVAVLAAGVALTGLGTTGAVPASAGPAVAAPGAGSECPRAATVAAGDRVTGKTVSSGTTPDAFRGEVLGVVQDLIAPDVDLVMVRLTSPEIDRVGGIWAGMSGSPVYDSTGRLVGAVSYGMSYGPSPVAGVTPAAEMQKLLSAAPTDSSAAATLDAARDRDRVDLPRSAERTLVASGAATAAEAESGLTRLPLVVGVSGPAGGRRLAVTLGRAGLDGARVVHTAAAPKGAPHDPLVSGGNLAAALSYGDYTVAAVGTATAVCGDEVLGFGHPFQWSGASSSSMHGASAVYVQEDPAWTPFKVANVGAPVGAVVQDRLAGVLGVTGAIPPTTDITSRVVAGTRARTGTTRITAPDLVPDLAAFHLVTDQLRVLDAHAKGSSTAAWTVTGTRAGGRTFAYTRSDRFASPEDIVWPAGDELFMQLSQLRDNGSEEVRVSAVSTRSRMGMPYQLFRIAAVKVAVKGVWRALPDTLRVRPGSVVHVRVTLTSAQRPTKRVLLDVPVPRAARGEGFLSIAGGNDLGGWEDFWENPSSGTSFDAVLRSIKRAPRNDDVVADLVLTRAGNGTATRSTRVTAPAVVSGSAGTNLVVVR